MSWMALSAAAGMLAVGNAQQSVGGTASGSHGHKQTSKYKQEFGPQTAPRRGDRMTTVKPGGKRSRKQERDQR